MYKRQAVHILEESSPNGVVRFAIFEVFLGLKREITEDDRKQRCKSVMPKGRGEDYRGDCERRPEIYRAGLESFRVCMFTVEHGAMKAGPTSVMLGVSHMMNKVIQHQVDFLCGDGNQATSTILSKQQEADFHNSMLATAARAALGAFNEGKWLHERVGFEFFDNNPYELTEQPLSLIHI